MDDIYKTLDSLTTNQNKKISKQEYELFCKEFVFEKLKGKKFGEAFCDKFGYNNFMLRDFSDETAMRVIKNMEYVKDDTRCNRKLY